MELQRRERKAISLLQQLSQEADNPPTFFRKKRKHFSAQAGVSLPQLPADHARQRHKGKKGPLSRLAVFHSYTVSQRSEKLGNADKRLARRAWLPNAPKLRRARKAKAAARAAGAAAGSAAGDEGEAAPESARWTIYAMSRLLGS